MLTGLQLGPIGAGTKHRHPRPPQLIGQARGEGPLRADHHQFDLVFSTGGHQANPMAGLDRQGFTTRNRPTGAIARG